jgi:hypothetical protein
VSRHVNNEIYEAQSTREIYYVAATSKFSAVR